MRNILYGTVYMIVLIKNKSRDMLALTRKSGESIVINNDVEITVLDIKGDQVKIGITAPKSVPVYRKEVYIQIQEANKAASNSDGMEALKNFLK